MVPNPLTHVCPECGNAIRRLGAVYCNPLCKDRSARRRRANRKKTGVQRYSTAQPRRQSVYYADGAAVTVVHGGRR